MSCKTSLQSSSLERSSTASNNFEGRAPAGREERPKYPGVTGPISTAPPRPSDIKRTKELEAVLREYGQFESTDELNRRLEVLTCIDELFQQWIQKLSIAKGYSESVAQTIQGKVFPFGSYTLGAHTKDADIDTLCVAPCHVERDDFFTSFAELLKQQPQVSNLQTIEEAFVPVIKMEFNGIKLDVLFARLALGNIPPDQELHDMSLLTNLDIKCVRSINGCRVTDEILQLVPDVEVFRTALRAVKLWAKRKGVYSNILGFLGGVSWAMLVARTCQLYPHATAAVIVQKLFLVFSQWPWPKPVYLKAQNSAHQHIGRFPVWDPSLNIADRYHVMPIITPTYPECNSTFNTSSSARTVVTKALKEGLEITTQIFNGKATWHDLFLPSRFFEQYKTFIMLTAEAHTDNDLLAWGGLVESRARRLISSIEKVPYIALSHINTRSYPAQPAMLQQQLDKPQHPGSPGSVASEDSLESYVEPTTKGLNWFIGLSFTATKEKVVLDLTEDVRTLRNMIFRQAKRCGTLRVGMELNVQVLMRKDLQSVLPPNEASLLSKSPQRKQKTERTLALDTAAVDAAIEPAQKKAKLL